MSVSANRKTIFLLAGILFSCFPTLWTFAQTLRFGNHRELTVPNYATIRIGPFYSSLVFSQSAAYSYSRSSGQGTDFLIRNRRGKILDDGSELPLVTTFDTRNYLIMTRNMDLDASVSAVYEHYPLGTQEDSFQISLAEEGIYGNLSTEVQITPFIKALLYESAVYRTDYVDTRGFVDPYGGSEYEYFKNTLGADMDWLMEEDMNMGLSLSRSDLLPHSESFADQESVAWHESLVLERRLIPAVVAGVSASFDQNQYTAETATNRHDTLLQSYFANVQARLTRRTVATASAGMSIGQTKGYDGNEKTFVGSLDLRTELNKELAHNISISRAIVAGFKTSFEIRDVAEYALNWRSEDSSARLATSFCRVDPDSDVVGSYADWTSSVEFLKSIYVGWAFADTINCHLSSRYSVRDSDSGSSATAVEWEEPEWFGQYRTWTSRLTLSFPLFFEDLSFSTYAEHMERSSDSGILDYKRDTLQAMVVYSHQF